MRNFKSSRICNKVPYGVKKNASFIIDTPKLKNKEDWKADDLGKWENRGNHGTVVTVDVENKIIDSEPVKKKMENRTKIQSNQLYTDRSYLL